MSISFLQLTANPAACHWVWLKWLPPSAQQVMEKPDHTPDESASCFSSAQPAHAQPVAAHMLPAWLAWLAWLARSKAKRPSALKAVQPWAVGLGLGAACTRFEHLGLPALSRLSASQITGLSSNFSPHLVSLLAVEPRD